MPSVLIVDDYLLVRQGLKQMLSQEGRGFVIGEAKTSDEATVRLARQPWDLVILDIAISGKDGFHVLQEIRRRHPSTRVLVLSMHADSEDAARAQQMGAWGCVSKHASRADFLRAFKSVFSGKKYFEGHISPGTGVKTVPRHAGLSTRERPACLGTVCQPIPGEMWPSKYLLTAECALESSQEIGAAGMLADAAPGPHL